MRFRRETWRGFYPEALALMERHNLELDEWPEDAFLINEGAFEAREAAGQLRIYTARLDNGPSESTKLVGYAMFLVAPDDCHPNSLRALQRALYLEPENREGFLGIDLVKFAERELRSDGVSVVYHFVKRVAPTLGRILARQGYREIESVWAKRLEVH